MEYIESSAKIAGYKKKYRYELTRIWDRNLPVLTWVMLNPSTADADADDATIRKCVGFTKRWSFGGIRVVNLFALRATNPKELLKASDPFGKDNLDTLHKSFQAGLDFVVAWGNNILLKIPDANMIAEYVAAIAEDASPRSARLRVVLSKVLVSRDHQAGATATPLEAGVQDKEGAVETIRS